MACPSVAISASAVRSGDGCGEPVLHRAGRPFPTHRQTPEVGQARSRRVFGQDDTHLGPIQLGPADCLELAFEEAHPEHAQLTAHICGVNPNAHGLVPVRPIAYGAVNPASSWDIAAGTGLKPAPIEVRCLGARAGVREDRKGGLVEYGRATTIAACPKRPEPI